MAKKASLQESETKGIAGVQSNAITLRDDITNQTLAIVEAKPSDSGEEPHITVHFRGPVSFDQLEAVNEFCRKKKFCKMLDKGRLVEAQAYAERKFSV